MKEKFSKRFFSLALIFFVASSLPLLAYQEGLPKIPITPEENANLLVLPEPINTVYSEYNPSVLSDSSLLFFESDRPGGQGNSGDFDIWLSHLESSNEDLSLPPTFSVPENLPLPVNTADFEGQPFIRENLQGQLELYFTSFASKNVNEEDTEQESVLRKGSQQTNIYVTRFIDKSWTTPTPVFQINSDFNDRMASLSQDGSLLFFSSDRPGGFGQDDIWYSRYDNTTQKWLPPVNAGEAINTDNSEISPSLHKDGVTLYFSSNREGGVGGYDLYVTQFEQENNMLLFRPVQNMGKPYNSIWDDEYPSVTEDGNHIYFSSNRENGFGLFDIYRAMVPNFAKPELLIPFEALVKEKGTEKGLEANIELQGLEGTQRISAGLADGNFSFQLKNRYIYKILITAPGFKPLYQTIDLRNINIRQTVQKTFELERIIALPPEFHIYVHFENEKGEQLLPKATYLVNPTMKATKEFTAEHFFLIEGKTDQKTNEEVKDYLKKFDVTITAFLQGYQSVQKNFSVYNVIFQNNHYPQSENHIIVTMRPDMEVSDPKDMPESKDAISIFYFANAVFEQVSESSGKNLDQLADFLKENSTLRIFIDGHTDKKGSKELNATLSKDRARFIFEQLKTKGISENRMFLRWFDYSKPAVAERENQGEKLNRRTEIHIIKSK